MLARIERRNRCTELKKLVYSHKLRKVAGPVKYCYEPRNVQFTRRVWLMDSFLVLILERIRENSNVRKILNKTQSLGEIDILYINVFNYKR